MASIGIHHFFKVRGFKRPLNGVINLTGSDDLELVDYVIAVVSELHAEGNTPGLIAVAGDLNAGFQGERRNHRDHAQAETPTFPYRFAISRASSATILAWSRVVAAEYTSAPLSPSEVSM